MNQTTLRKAYKCNAYI